MAEAVKAAAAVEVMAMKEAMGVAGRVDNRYDQAGKLAVNQGVMVRAAGVAEPVAAETAEEAKAKGAMMAKPKAMVTEARWWRPFPI